MTKPWKMAKSVSSKSNPTLLYFFKMFNFWFFTWKVNWRSFKKIKNHKKLFVNFFSVYFVYYCLLFMSFEQCIELEQSPLRCSFYAKLCMFFVFFFWCLLVFHYGILFYYFCIIYWHVFVWVSSPFWKNFRCRCSRFIPCGAWEKAVLILTTRESKVNGNLSCLFVFRKLQATRPFWSTCWWN